MKACRYAVSVTVMKAAAAVMAISGLMSVPSAADDRVPDAGIRKGLRSRAERTEAFRQAEELYESGLYVRARQLFSSISDGDEVAQGYAVLCGVLMDSADCAAEMERYISAYPYSGLIPRMRYAHALNLFDKSEYAGAAEQFSKVSPKVAGKSGKAEFLFKKAYSEFGSGNPEEALEGFRAVTALPRNDYQAPAAYSIGYILYEKEKFGEAAGWFEKSAVDARFAEASSFYLMECRFMTGDYRYVTENGDKMYAQVPEVRRQHLARIISESYLVLGDAGKAKEYYDKISVTAGRGRADCFYAGSLLYALQDYKGAVENYSLMPDRTDSLGQIANYQLAYSYIQIKNKVAALKAFKDAASYGFNADIEEDAYFNFAKLSFDLNNDPSVFDSYIAKYSDKSKGDRIYSYMALAALYSRDYARAVEAYDKIDVLDDNMRNNYMKANYLRAEQLIEAGSFRSAVPCLKASAYYSGDRSALNHLSRYWLAEAYYRDDDFRSSLELYKALYNVSALDGRPEGYLIPYNIAYCYYKMGDYAQAAQWFDNYAGTGDKTCLRDALIRRGDCAFISKDYPGAVEAYESAIRRYPQLDDLYPYYQAGTAYSLTEKTSSEIKLLSEALGAPSDAYFWCETIYELGRAHMSSGDNDAAAECYKKIASSGRDSTYQAKALIGLGMIAANESQYEDALGYYKRVISEMPASDYSRDALAAIEAIYQDRQEPEKYFAYLKTLPMGQDAAGADKEAMYFNAAEQVFLAENYQKALVLLQAYMEEYPQGAHLDLAHFYMAESYKCLGKKEQACDWYGKVIESGEGPFVEASSLSFASLSYSMERYKDAYGGYQKLLDVAKIENNRHTAIVGMMNSAYAAGDYKSAIECAARVGADSSSDADEVRRSDYVAAKSCLATSDRDAAFGILRKLSSSPSTPEGAEATFMLIQDSYDRGDFTDVENMVYKFSDAGTDQTYWLAKSFILLGDAFAERGDLRQAKATFESIRDGYTPQSKDDDVPGSVDMRLAKIAEMTAGEGSGAAGE